MDRRLVSRIAVITTLLGVCSTASATEWTFHAELYALAADVSASTRFGTEAGADFDEVVENLEFAMFGSLAAKKDRVALIGNLLYVDVADSQHQSSGLFASETEVELESTVASLAAGWDFVASKSTSLHALAGVRYLSLDGHIQLAIEPLEKRSKRASTDNWDAILGLYGRTELSNSWYLTYYADTGAGDSDLTWQASAAISYRFETLDVALGYQYLGWRFDDRLVEDMEIAGPAIGVRFSW